MNSIDIKNKMKEGSEQGQLCKWLFHIVNDELRWNQWSSHSRVSERGINNSAYHLLFDIKVEDKGDLLNNTGRLKGKQNMNLLEKYQDITKFYFNFRFGELDEKFRVVPYRSFIYRGKMISDCVETSIRNMYNSVCILDKKSYSSPHPEYDERTHVLWKEHLDKTFPNFKMYKKVHIGPYLENVHIFLKKYPLKPNVKSTFDPKLTTFILTEDGIEYKFSLKMSDKHMVYLSDRDRSN